MTTELDRQKRRTTTQRRSRFSPPSFFHVVLEENASRLHRIQASKQAKKREREKRTVRYRANREKERRKKERKTLEGPPDVPPHFSSDLRGPLPTYLPAPSADRNYKTHFFPRPRFLPLLFSSLLLATIIQAMQLASPGILSTLFTGRDHDRALEP